MSTLPSSIQRSIVAWEFPRGSHTGGWIRICPLENSSCSSHSRRIPVRNPHGKQLSSLLGRLSIVCLLARVLSLYVRTRREETYHHARSNQRGPSLHIVPTVLRARWWLACFQVIPCTKICFILKKIVTLQVIVY